MHPEGQWKFLDILPPPGGGSVRPIIEGEATIQKLTCRAFSLSACLTLAVVSCSLLLAYPAHGQIIQEECIYGTVPEMIGCGDTGCTTYATFAEICDPQTATCQNTEAGAEYMDQCCSDQYGNWGVLPQSENFCEQLARGPERGDRTRSGSPITPKLVLSKSSPPSGARPGTCTSSTARGAMILPSSPRRYEPTRRGRRRGSPRREVHGPRGDRRASFRHGRPLLRVRGKARGKE